MRATRLTALAAAAVATATLAGCGGPPEPSSVYAPDNLTAAWDFLDAVVRDDAVQACALATDHLIGDPAADETQMATFVYYARADGRDGADCAAGFESWRRRLSWVSTLAATSPAPTPTFTLSPDAPDKLTECPARPQDGAPIYLEGSAAGSPWTNSFGIKVACTDGSGWQVADAW
jgi:hypothetical protein